MLQNKINRPPRLDVVTPLNTPLGGSRTLFCGVGGGGAIWPFKTPNKEQNVYILLFIEFTVVLLRTAHTVGDVLYCGR